MPGMNPVLSLCRNKGLLMLTAVAAAAIFLISLAPAVQAAPVAVEDGSLQWGVKLSFRNYIVGPIAHGHINVSDGATQAASNGVFTFPDASGSYDTGAVAAAFGGTVHFQGHEGVGVPAGEYALDLKITDIRISINGATGVLIADVESKGLATGAIESFPDVELASLNLTGITPVVTGDSVSFSAIPAVLTAAGAPAFAGFYPAGTELDPISFTLALAEEEPEPEPEPEPGSATQTITTEVVASGALTISVAGDEVLLPSPVLNTAGTALVSTGTINAVTVTDLRTSNPGWSASGQVSDFVSGSDSFGGDLLGWTPEVVSSSAGQVVAAGSAVEPGVGLSSPATLGSAGAGEGRGTAVLGAELELELPTDTAPGEYSATLTLTVI